MQIISMITDAIEKIQTGKYMDEVAWFQKMERYFKTHTKYSSVINSKSPRLTAEYEGVQRVTIDGYGWVHAHTFGIYCETHAGSICNISIYKPANHDIIIYETKVPVSPSHDADDEAVVCDAYDGFMIGHCGDKDKPKLMEELSMVSDFKKVDDFGELIGSLILMDFMH